MLLICGLYFLQITLWQINKKLNNQDLVLLSSTFLSNLCSILRRDKSCSKKWSPQKFLMQNNYKNNGSQSKQITQRTQKINYDVSFFY